MEKDLSKQMAATYRMLRLGLAVLAFALPLLLWLGGYFIYDVPLAGSLSAYYHASHVPPPQVYGGGVLRNVFVGIIFAVSILLFAYQGFTRLEDWALNLAGLLAVGVALVPTPLVGGGLWTLHGAFAILFFVSIGYVSIFRAGDTLRLIKDDATRERFRMTYKILGWAMVVLPLSAFAFFTFIGGGYTTFFVEFAGIYVFATYWVVKSREAKKTRMDEEATRGNLKVKRHGLADALSPLPVTPAGDDNAE